MKTISALVLALALLLPSLAQAADDAPQPVVLSQQDLRDLKRVEEYFNGLGPLQSQFIQRAGQYDGSIGEVTGTFKLWRPGRLRIDYAKPSEDFIVADGSTLYQWDSQMRQQSQASIDSTLAGFILRKNLNFSGDDVTVTKVYHPTPDKMEITLRSVKDPGAGELTVLLNDVPLSLLGWRVLDAQNLVTTVELQDVQTGIKLDEADFRFRNPDFGKNTRNGVR